MPVATDLLPEITPFSPMRYVDTIPTIITLHVTYTFICHARPQTKDYWYISTDDTDAHSSQTSVVDSIRWCVLGFWWSAIGGSRRFLALLRNRFRERSRLWLDLYPQQRLCLAFDY